MIERNGDIFDTKANYIAHGVNTYGVMGAGIAKQFRDRFPENYRLYSEWCFNGDLLPGGMMGVREQHDGREIVVLNLASQNKPGPDAKYQWLFSSLMSAAEMILNADRFTARGGLIAIPEIGCGIGGLDWDGVKTVLNTVEYICPGIEFELWHYGV